MLQINPGPGFKNRTFCVAFASFPCLYGFLPGTLALPKKYTLGYLMILDWL